MAKGTCKKQNPFRGVITVSEKGQIVVPADLREDLGIARGDKLIVLERPDKQGFTCLKENAIENTLKKLAEG
jgi:AbrB family looped-hinge helix DNA binding protein